MTDLAISKPVQAATGYGFTEGSSVSADGRVFFTDQPKNKIYIWDESKGISVFKEECERSNGTYFDSNDLLYACADLHNRLIKIKPDGEIVGVHDLGYGGKPLNGPNDLWIDKKGGIYITDPYYHRNYWEPGHVQPQDVQAVYYLKPGGELIRVIDDLKQPNGIVGTPNGKFLFVSDISDQKTWKYSINEDGTLKDKVYYAPYGSDGITLDNMGNLYLTSGSVIIINNKGIKSGEIDLPEAPSNLCFGGKDRNILFITARTSVYVVKMKVRGVE
jgi:gluconolactonase